MNTHTVIKLRAAEVGLIEKGIVQVVTAANYETTTEDVNEINKAVSSLVRDEKYLILVITQQGSYSSAEAREHAAQNSFRNNVVAEAIVINNLALRLAATVYMKVNRPKQKIKLFNSKEKALAWLRKERKKLK